MQSSPLLLPLLPLPPSSLLLPPSSPLPFPPSPLTLLFIFAHSFTPVSQVPHTFPMSEYPYLLTSLCSPLLLSLILLSSLSFILLLSLPSSPPLSFYSLLFDVCLDLKKCLKYYYDCICEYICSACLYISFHNFW